MKKFLEKHKDYFFTVFRVLVGLLFLLHGLQKLPVILDSSKLFSLMGLAGIIEIVGGVLLIVGLFTKSVALITAVEMLIAYFKVHAPNALSPLANKGEPALLFFAAFLVLLVYGAGKYSLDNWWLKN